MQTNRLRHPEPSPASVGDARELERLTLIARITNPVVGTEPLREQVSKLLDQVCVAYGVDACVVRTINGNCMDLLAATGVAMSQLIQRLPITEGIAPRLIGERRAFEIEDVETESTTASLASSACNDVTKFQFRSYAGAPLLRENQVIGLIGIYSTRNIRRFTTSELNHLQIVANHIAISIVNDRLYRELEENRGELQTQIQERERAEAHRLAIEEQLRHAQRMEALGQLAGGVAHDFNNLLTVILGGAEFLLETISEHESALDREWILQIEGAARRASQLTRHLLAFSRKQPNNPKVLDVTVLIRNLQGMLRRLVREDIELVQTCDTRPCLVFADAGQMEQVIINLVVNARDAITGAGRIEIGCSRSPRISGDHGASSANGDHVLIHVSDDGVGMDATTVAHIFEPFFTTKAPGSGTGLGLSTAYGIVMQAGGEIEVDSRPNAGTNFRVLLPAYQGDAVESIREEESPRPLRGSESVLVCEDEALVRDVICTTLRGAGYEVLEADEPRNALLLARESGKELDLLVTDMVMPRMNGRELAKLLRRDNPTLRCLIVSGYLGDMDETQAHTCKDIRFLPKPFGPQALLKTVRDILGSPVMTSDRASG